MPFFSFLNFFRSTKTQSAKDLIESINAIEPHLATVSDEELAQTTQTLRKLLEEGASLDALLPQAFAAVREAAKRQLGMRAYDVQMYAGLCLHKGQVAEMKTGEGKTLMAAFPTYLNALTGKGVHVVTVNDYLAQRDSETMGKVFAALGASTGLVHSQQGDVQKKQAYACDITYGTNHELGFDFLRDGLKTSHDDMSQRGLNFAIIDEIDSILIDDARTPLIISGMGENPGEICAIMADIVAQAKPEHWTLNEQNRQVIWTEAGDDFLAHELNARQLLPEHVALYHHESGPMIHRATQALRARLLFQKNKQYVVQDDKIALVDESTGRIMEGRRLSEGLHQALEAKENVTVERENVTLASISLQNFFRGYTKISGMTGTAATEAEEFKDIYNLDVVPVATHRPIARIDEPDRIFRSQDAKWAAIVAEIKEAHATGQPVLAGTSSVEKSDYLSDLLRKAGVRHSVLNARHHAREADIIAQAGRKGAVTIATNMAGRGTDIQLGGSVDAIVAQEENALLDRFHQGLDEHLVIDHAALRAQAQQTIQLEKEQVLAAGGLLVVATERHESRRIDNQLRGRAGRQGDPGRSVFFVSLDDDLMRIFGGEKLAQTMGKLGMSDTESLSHPWVTKAVANAQKKVEGRNFDSRKNILKYDDIANEQRKIAREMRENFMSGAINLEDILDMQASYITDVVAECLPEKSYASDYENLARKMDRLGIDTNPDSWNTQTTRDPQAIEEELQRKGEERLHYLQAHLGEHAFNSILRHTLLQSFDANWRDHVMQLEFLKTAVGFQGYAQRDPIHEYRTHAHSLFEEALNATRLEAIHLIGGMRLEAPNSNPLGLQVFAPSQEVAYV